jgi:hypothetical protein
VGELRAEQALRREDRAIESSFLTLQGHLGGGGTLYGEADSESFATITGALDAAAAAPAATADDDARSRGAQLMDALVAISEASLSGGLSAGRTRPRPRLIACVDAAMLAGMGLSEGARVLPSVAGRPLRITPLSTGVLACDADIVPVVFDRGKPIGVGDIMPTIPARLRTALIARDGGCRFPGCSATVAWCDAHHIVPRSAGGDASVDNLQLLCRRCHRRVHRYRWKITLRPDAAIAFTCRGRMFTSVSRTRPPPGE